MTLEEIKSNMTEEQWAEWLQKEIKKNEKKWKELINESRKLLRRDHKKHV